MTERDQLPKWEKELKRTERLLKDQAFEHQRVMAAYRKGVTSLEEFEAEKKVIEGDQAQLRASREQLEALIQGE